MQNLIFNSLLDSSYNYSLFDIDNNEYTSVIIGNQEWIQQNLKTTHYANNTPITKLEVNANWIIDASGAYCEYDNSVGLYKDTYGYIYNWFAIDNSNGIVYFKRNNIVETGWRVPSSSDWLELINFVGGGQTAGGKLKEVGTTHWDSPNAGATDNYNFTALPAGRRNPVTGEFNSIRSNGSFWNREQSDINNGSGVYFTKDSSVAGSFSSSKFGGYSIHCVK